MEILLKRNLRWLSTSRTCSSSFKSKSQPDPLLLAELPMALPFRRRPAFNKRIKQKEMVKSKTSAEKDIDTLAMKKMEALTSLRQDIMETITINRENSSRFLQ